MVGIHHLAWVDNLDAGAIVVVQRHEDWMVATANSSIYASRTDPDSYITCYERPEGTFHGWNGSTEVEYEHASQRSCRSFSK